MNDDGCGNSRYKGDNLDDEEGNFVLKEEIEGGVDGQITQPEAYSYTCGSLLCVFVTYGLRLLATHLPEAKHTHTHITYERARAWAMAYVPNSNPI